MVFTPKHIGQFIGIGEDLVLEITGEIEPCERMNEVFPGLKDVLAIHMRCGVTCRVIVPGSISIWDAVAIHPHYPI
jgi:MOSC domain-containing protein YiiM